MPRSAFRACTTVHMQQFAGPLLSQTPFSIMSGIMCSAAGPSGNPSSHTFDLWDIWGASQVNLPIIQWALLTQKVTTPLSKPVFLSLTLSPLWPLVTEKLDRIVTAGIPASNLSHNDGWLPVEPTGNPTLPQGDISCFSKEARFWWSPSAVRPVKLMKAPTSFSSANSAAELIYPSTFYLVSFSLLILIEEHFRFCLYLWNSFESQIFLIFLRKTWNTALLKVKILTFYCYCDTTAHYCWVIFQIIGVVKSSTRLLSKTSCFVRISWELRHSMQTSRSVVWPWGSRQARTKRLCMYRCVFACV